jgi:peptide/nickel transport system substrate-binding protein
VYWHDGEKFTAEDVKFTIDAIMNPETGASLRSEWSVKEAEIIDDYTIAMHFDNPRAIVLLLAAAPTFSIIPEHVLKDVDPSEWRTHYFNTQAVEGGPYPGTGPYKMVEWKTGEYIKYEAFEDYWAGEPSIKTMYIQFIEEPTTALVALQNNEVNFLSRQVVDPIITQVKELEGSDVIVNWFPGTTVPWISFNNHHPILNNKYVRLAIAHAIPTDRIINDLLDGLAQPATGPIPPTSPFYSDKITPYTYDPDLAKEYLAKAGYEIKEVEPTQPQTNYLLPAIGLIVGLVIGAAAIYMITGREN